MNCDHTFTPRPWGIACRCGAFVDFGRPGTEAECEWEAQSRREGREVTERLREKEMQNA